MIPLMNKMENLIIMFIRQPYIILVIKIIRETIISGSTTTMMDRKIGRMFVLMC